MYIQQGTEEGVTLDTYGTLTRSLRNRRMRKYSRVCNHIMIDCNPASYFSWIDQREQKGLLRKFDSTHQDNPAFYDRQKQCWTPDGEEYIGKVLAAMTGLRRKRFFLGEWAAAEGLIYDGFIGKPWDDPTEPGHLFPAGWSPPLTWDRVWGIDWGESAPTVLSLCAVDPDCRV